MSAIPGFSRLCDSGYAGIRTEVCCDMSLDGNGHMGMLSNRSVSLSTPLLWWNQIRALRRSEGRVDDCLVGASIVSPGYARDTWSHMMIPNISMEQ